MESVYAVSVADLRRAAAQASIVAQLTQRRAPRGKR